MKFLIIGAGGIGAYYGARLIEAGHQVVLVARGEHLRAMQQRGLKVRHESLNFNQAVTAFDAGTLMRHYGPDDFDVALLALKSTATAPVLEELSGWLKPGRLPVLSLQNGVDNEPLLAEALGNERVIGGLAVRIGGHILEPGVVEAEGPAQVVMGAWPMEPETPDTRADLLQRLETCFNGAGIPARTSPDIRTELWRKLVINNGVNPLSALTLLDTRSLTHHAEFGPIVYGLMQETAEAARADGVELSQADIDEMHELIRSFNAIKTSMLVDREKGRPLELDSIAGAVLDRCRHQDVAAPYTELVMALLRHVGAAPRSE
ncbi:ketopantoate reductase family protein [Marinobacterium aestuariivivens]|uniref:2-dehydropantoate 2-reductase n=1 Tax=Marinobacterium aestuariivivens TaxID=1698799 RepID=A0ABW2A2J5_9GAMM